MVLVKRHDALGADEHYYHLLATWISQGYGFNVPGADVPFGTLHPPLYPLLLAPVTWIASGSAVLAQRLVGAAIGAATVFVVGVLGREVSGERAGIIAAVLAAVAPMLWVSDGIIMAESLAALLVAVTLVLAYRSIRAPSIGRAIVLGVVCGLAALTRGELVLLVVFVALPATLRSGDARRRAARAGCVLLGATFVIAPWAAYTSARFDRPVLVSSNLGVTLCGANNRVTYSGSDIGLWDQDACPPDDSSLDAFAQNDHWTRTSIAYARDHATRLPFVAAARVGRILGVYAPNQMVDFELLTGARPRGVSWAITVLFPVLLATAVYGWVLLRKRRMLAAPLVGTLAMVLVVALLTSGDLRYRVPADVALVVLAAVAVEQLATRFGLLRANCWEA